MGKFLELYIIRHRWYEIKWVLKTSTCNMLNIYFLLADCSSQQIRWKTQLTAFLSFNSKYMEQKFRLYNTYSRYSRYASIDPTVRVANFPQFT